MATPEHPGRWQLGWASKKMRRKNEYSFFSCCRRSPIGFGRPVRLMIAVHRGIGADRWIGVFLAIGADRLSGAPRRTSGVRFSGV